MIYALVQVCGPLWPPLRSRVSRVSWSQGPAWAVPGLAASRSPGSILATGPTGIRNRGSTFGPWIVGLSVDLARVCDRLFSFSLGVPWIRSLRTTQRFLNTNQATLGSANETLSAGLGRVLDKLLFTGVVLKIGFGGLELENLRIIAGEILTTSSSEEVDSLSSSSVLPRCVVR